jgi:hypothetical protein
VLAAENMLIKIIERARILHKRNQLQYIPSSLKYFMDNDITEDHLLENALFLLNKFAALDDFDIFSAIKEWQNEEDLLLAFICKSLLNRELFKLKFSDVPISEERLLMEKSNLKNWWKGSDEEMSFLLFSGKESNRAYSYAQEEIKILTKEGVVKPMSDCVDYPLPPGGIEKYYLCYASKLKEKDALI